MTKNLRFVPVIAGMLAWLLTPTSAQSVDQSFYYKLSTQFRGNGMKLDVFNGGPKNNLEPGSRCLGPVLEIRRERRRYLSPINSVPRPRHVLRHFQWRRKQ